jgi:D-arabinose 1-dehydrogenase-like Zn-dependent alcohol dehydrogenase
VLFTGISRNDILYSEGKHRKDYFGVEAVGRVVAIGKNAGTRKVGDIVGVFHSNVNNGTYTTGFASHLQVHQDEVVYIPHTIAPELATSLLGSGVIAFNVLEQIEKGASVAVFGTGILAYLTTQFAKKVFGLKVTLFGYEGGEDLAQSFGADGYIALSKEAIKKQN